MNKKLQNLRIAKNGILLSFLLIFLIFPIQLYSQTCTSVVGGSTFEPVSGHEDDYFYDFNLMKSRGPSGNKFSSTVALADSAQLFEDGKSYVYGVTSNPSLLNKDYLDVDDSMFVVTLQTASTTNLFSYMVNGLKAGSDYTIKLKVYHLPDPASDCAVDNPWLESNIMIAVNPDAYGGGYKNYSLKSGADSWGKSFDITITGTLDATKTSIDLEMQSGYNFAKCSAIGIADLVIYGCLDPKVKSSQGNEVCKGEQSLFTLDRDYGSTTYKWEKSTNGGGSWITISTKKSVYDEVKEDAIYRCTVGGTLTDEYKVSAIKCCEDENGNAASRKTVFFDDFGHFVDADTYEDAEGNVLTGLTKHYRADVNYSIPQNKYDPTGDVNDGFYAVSSLSPHTSFASWFNGVASDHGENTDGGLLFINVNYNYVGVVYDRLIDNLCEGKELFFEAYLACASVSDNPPVVRLNIKSPDGSKLLATADATAKNGDGWVRVQVNPFILSGYTSVRVEVDSRGGEGTSGDAYWRGGNDLFLDDIKFMVCSPPNIDAYSDIVNYVQDTIICADTDFDMATKASALLSTFFGGEEKYLYQHSADGVTWDNISGIESDDNFIFNSSKFPGKVNYFRVVVARDVALNKFLTDPNDVDFDDNCRNYSVSKPFSITRSADLDMGKDVQESACGGEIISLSGSIDPNIVTWSWETATGNVLVPLTSDVTLKDYDLKVDKTDTLYFIGYTQDGCRGKRKYEITQKSTAKISLDTIFACGKSTVKATTIPATANITWTLNDAPMSSTSSTLEFLPGESGYLVGKASATGYCESDTLGVFVTVDTIPSETLDATTPFC
ncbi:MAG: hypothetical protein M0P12_13870, partial [Paludibacteraceae bacterium]|nr:hypothetical protein [Paludibacteraceae bacterium]